ncbi:uncharacterized protein V5649_008911 [Rhynchonycteris naso]
MKRKPRSLGWRPKGGGPRRDPALQSQPSGLGGPPPHRDGPCRPPTPARTHTHSHARSLTHTPAALRRHRRLTSCSARPALSLPPAGLACALRGDHVGSGSGRGSGSVSGRAGENEQRGTRAHPNPRSASTAASSWLHSPTLQPRSRSLPAQAGQRLPPLRCSCRRHRRGRRPGMGRSRAPGSGRRGDCTGSGSDCTNRAAAATPAALPAPATPCPSLRAPRAPPPAPGRAQSPCSAAGADPSRSTTARPAKPASEGKPSPWGAKAERPPAGQPTPSPDPLAPTALFGKKSE